MQNKEAGFCPAYIYSHTKTFFTYTFINTHINLLLSPFLSSTVPMSLLTPSPGPNPAVNDFVRSRSEALILAKEALAAAQERQAATVDTHRRDHDFKISDQALLNLENITHPADRTRTSQKLLARFAGPHPIVEQLSPVSFCLDLPPTMKFTLFSMSTVSTTATHHPQHSDRERQHDRHRRLSRMKRSTGSKE